MKFIVIGLGQCGSRIADEFARLNNRAVANRRIQICPGTFAVNTDATDLSGLRYIKTDFQHRIVMGGRKTAGHGVGKINEMGAEIAKADGDKVIDAIRSVKNLFEADAFLLAASTGGGTGSGSIGVIAKMVKERYNDMPVYTCMVLPFDHECETEERTVYNTATCLKSVNQVSDAVFLIDNQRYVRKDSSLANNMAKINQQIVEPFYNMLCAGEEKKAKFVGAKTLDAGDVMATINGWTVIGWGRSQMGLFRMPWSQTRDFLKKSNEMSKGIYAMGGNMEAAKRAGFSIIKIQFFIYSYVGFLSGIASVLYVSLVRHVHPFNLMNILLDVIAAVVLGGASLAGGSGTVLGTMLGVMMIYFIKNSLVLMKVPSYWDPVVIGLIIVVSTGINAYSKVIGKSRLATIEM